MESCISDVQRIVRTHHNVLRTLQFAGNVLPNDGQNITNTDTKVNMHCIHGQHCSNGGYQGRVETKYTGSAGDSEGKPAVSQRIEVTLGGHRMPHSEICGGRRMTPDGR